MTLYLFQGPEGSVDKPFLWTEGRVSLRAALNKSAYGHGEHISVTIDVRNDSRKIIRKIRVSTPHSYIFLIFFFNAIYITTIHIKLGISLILYISSDGIQLYLYIGDNINCFLIT